MTMTEYAQSRGLNCSLIAKQAGITRQSVQQIGIDGRSPTHKRLTKITTAMTELGAPTTVVQLFSALYSGSPQENGDENKKRD